MRAGLRMLVIVGCTAVLAAPTDYERTVDRYGERAKPDSRSSTGAVSQPAAASRIARLAELRTRHSASAAADRARAMLQAAVKAEDKESRSLLGRVIATELPPSPRADEILAKAFRRLGDLHEGVPTKQVLLYASALGHERNPAVRKRLEKRIADLGGDVFALTFGAIDRGRHAPRDAGPDDTCEGAVSVAIDIGSPYVEVMNIQPSGDHNWRRFEIPGPEAWALRIETISDQPGTFTDDTDLGLWNGCPDASGVLQEWNDDRPGDFTSLIETSCTNAPGTYYIEVGGFFDTATPDHFTLAIEVIDACTLPGIDAFEPDDRRHEAGRIGHPTSTPPNAAGWGRARREVQARTIFPAGDEDYVRFSLTREELVRLSTKRTHPTFFNNFAETDPLDNPDTVLTLFYENDADYGGRCNQPDDGFLPVCYSDEDCPDPLNNPLPGFPPCIPLITWGVPVGFENPLAFSDDRSGVDLGSELLLCLPRNTPQRPDRYHDGGDWLVRVTPFSVTDVFDYELMVKNEVTCLYEQEPNDDFADATPLSLGDTVHGIYDFVSTNPVADADLYRWDVDEETVVTFETEGYDDYAVDTAFELFVGCTDGSEFFELATDDDGGTGFLSLLSVVAPPADELMGIADCDADYFLNVTSFFYNENYPYTLVSSVARAPIVEQEPNDNCSTADAIVLGDRMTAQVGSLTCDYDAFAFRLTENTFVTIAAPAGADTAIELRDRDEDALLACDDDGGPGTLPRIEGCLPPGEYCARVRSFTGYQLEYDLELTGQAGCLPTVPPSLSADGAFTCLDFDSCP